MEIETEISVIIPAYNHARYIEACLKSVVEQTHPKLELIIINDGSRDSTNEKILEFLPGYKKRFSDIVYINRENKGIGATLNELVQHAKSEYIFQLASDDMAKPDAIEKLLAFMEVHPDYALAVGDNEIIDDQGNRIFWDRNKKTTEEPKKIKYKTFGEFLQKKRPDVNFNSDEFGQLKSLLFGNYIPNGKMFRKSSILEVGGYTDYVLEDYYINILLARKYKMKFINQVTISYRWHEGNTIKNSEYVKMLNGNMQAFLKDQRSEAKRRGVFRLPFSFELQKLRLHNLLTRMPFRYSSTSSFIPSSKETGE